MAKNPQSELKLKMCRPCFKWCHELWSEHCPSPPREEEEGRFGPEVLTVCQNQYIQIKRRVFSMHELTFKTPTNLML